MPALNYRTIKMGKPDGTDWVEFSAATVSIPDPYPEINAKANNKSYQMRPTIDGPGRLVWKSSGSNINHSEISFTAHKIEADQQQLLDEMYKAIPNVILFSLDGGTTRYFAIFDSDNSLVFEPYRNNEDMFNKKAYFVKANITLKILNSTTVDFEVV